MAEHLVDKILGGTPYRIKRAAPSAEPLNAPVAKRKQKKAVAHIDPRMHLFTKEQLEAAGIEVLNPSSVDVFEGDHKAYEKRPTPHLLGNLDALSQRPYAHNPTLLKGYTFVVTGILDTFERDEAQDYLKSFGAHVASGVTKSLTHALVGIQAGRAKIKAIEKANVPILNEIGLYNLIRHLASNPV